MSYVIQIGLFLGGIGSAILHVASFMRVTVHLRCVHEDVVIMTFALALDDGALK